MSYDVAVIGGGISGLATAYELQARGLNVIVLERQIRAGGNAVSERLDGYLMEHGPSTVNALSSAALGLSARVALTNEQCELGAGVKRRYLVGDGELQGIPAHPLGFLASDYLSVKGRLRLMMEFMVPRYRSEREESIADFSARRFGKEFADKVIDPLVAGIYAGRADELSVTAGFPKLAQLEQAHGSIAAGLVKRHRQGAKMPSSRLFSWKNGIGTLPSALARSLGARVRTGVTVRCIRRSGDGFAVDVGAAGSVKAGALVMATQPHVAACMLESLDDIAAGAAGAIVAPPLAVVYLGYRRGRVAHPLDGLGFLSPENEGLNMSGSQFCSTMFPGRAPEGHVSLAAYFGGARAPHLAELPASELIALAREEFAGLLGASGEPEVACVRHWPRGLPQYRLGHQERVANLMDAERRVPGLFITGNYFSGPAVAECITRAGDTAERVIVNIRDQMNVAAPIWSSATSTQAVVA
ncbi:MAG: protoporphyrinogen oxidase [Rhodospirillaceae bacterium]|jgi:protoporphyrinogen/coproporphyrinogen III oxidase|nr:protoporphyrinogen oxidase [Rhodospirillaceae bacterium]MBT3883562.1 protoporphyrinogen oxidase [Rhodospirillaceae bacterium]MBT4117539.1 protoporphyrinogen oxidase [Rhodospirillaceae bacterium]MBT4670630.1 protoporphyrinogen oxidase [Rhodospirillaceae bacterium]MBT4749875.1 protoporphyrinogen oxidase [Rhodospirillaceae bacterium]